MIETREKLEAVARFVVANAPQQQAGQIDRAMILYGMLVKTAGIRPE